jgi:hypothetical protein
MRVKNPEQDSEPFATRNPMSDSEPTKLRNPIRASEPTDEEIHVEIVRH